MKKSDPQTKEYSLLSDKKILIHIKDGNIIISPFKKKNLGSVSYDVSLGRYYFREQHPGFGFRLFNPYNRKHVEKIWGGPETAKVAKELMGQWVNKVDWEGILPGDRVILVGPGETILAHTEEFIGGRNGITTMMKARSSFGRVFVDVCKSAGWGDVGYINRWTMEITNYSASYTIPLIVGRRIAQMVFFEVGPTIKEYTKRQQILKRFGKVGNPKICYQDFGKIEKLFRKDE
jgi:dCTP deaminase